MFDYHLHLELDAVPGPYSYSPARLARYTEAAARRGIEEIGITEHSFRFKQFRPAMAHLLEPEPAAGGHWLPGEFQNSLDEYVSALHAARKEGHAVKIGIEVDYIPESEKALGAILSGYPWDFILGAVHFLPGWCIDVSPDYGWPEVPVDEAVKQYYKTVQAAASSGLFDVIAHPDLIKKFGHEPSFDLGPLYEETARTFAAAGVAADFNTNGWFAPAGEAYPSPAFLRVLARHGVPLTFGSDAHRPDDIGREFPRAAALARRQGHTGMAVYSKRQRTMVPLPLPEQ